MRLRIFVEPQQGASYEQLAAVATTAEQLGFDGFFRSDHFLRMGAGDPRPGPTDAWVTLAGLARETTRLRLGTLLSSATFRLPGPLAVTVAQVDAMSGGRVELGLGAGWFEDEHRAFGIPFPSTRERFERLAEQLAIVTGLWAATEEEPFSFEGRHYQLAANAGWPKPVQVPRPPIIVGGAGLVRTPRLAARFADELNVPFPPLDHFRAVQRAADDACVAAGRPPGDLARSVALVVCCASTEAELHRRAEAIGRQVDELRANGAAGRPAEVVETLQRFADAGASTAYLQVLDLADLDHLALLAAEVVPAVG
jgi:F420-dependent oxidoreductase-like protein